MDWEDLTAFTPSTDLLSALEASTAAGYPWSHTSHKTAKDLLKSELFLAQKSQCSYCRRTIMDDDGHVEIDHILPKSSRGVEHWASNQRMHRRRTSGYENFTFTIFNLILTCKRCNNRKGSYDHRLDRSSVVPGLYNLDPAYFEWVHPYLHRYSEHITILQNLIYQVRNNSANGDAVIYACKLDKISAIEAKARDNLLKRSSSYKNAIKDLLSQVDVIGWDAVVELVTDQFPHVPPRDIERLTETIKNALKE